jgi:L-seryl-tRNA(Ser) seleniumtransferase
MATEVLRAKLARLLTAEASLACRSLPGAVLMAIGGCIAGPDLAAVLRLPEVGGRERRVVLQRGQVRALEGAPLLQILRLVGAEPVEVGDATDELAAFLAAGAAAGLWLAGQTASGSPVDLPGFVWACRTAGVPSVVVCAEPTGPLAALDVGADLALADSAALHGGPAAGLILGRSDLVRRCAIQERGIGALFPTDEATLAAIVAAVEAAAGDPAGGRAVADLTAPEG